MIAFGVSVVYFVVGLIGLALVAAFAMFGASLVVRFFIEIIAGLIDAVRNGPRRVLRRQHLAWRVTKRAFSIGEGRISAIAYLGSASLGTLFVLWLGSALVVGIAVGGWKLATQVAKQL